MKQEVWVVNFYEEHFELFATKEKAIKAIEHNYRLIWDGDRAEGFHRFEGDPECAGLSIYPQEVF